MLLLRNLGKSERGFYLESYLNFYSKRHVKCTHALKVYKHSLTPQDAFGVMGKGSEPHPPTPRSLGVQKHLANRTASFTVEVFIRILGCVEILWITEAHAWRSHLHVGAVDGSGHTTAITRWLRTSISDPS